MSYRCKRCGKAMAATYKDPVAVVARGSYHVACLVAEGQERRAAEELEMEAKRACKVQRGTEYV